MRSQASTVGFALAAVLTFACLARADVYMHNPRGSNDRNCERNVNRDNGNRLFDSQNNAKGGYACPRAVGDENVQSEEGVAQFSTFSQNKRMYYYEGSILPIEWTSQHGCGYNSKLSCEIIVQYACEDSLDPQVDGFWPFTAGKNMLNTGGAGNNVGLQHFRFDSHTAAPRDGVPRDSNDAATDTINDDEASAIPSTIETRRYGMHESYDYYQICQRTERNKGLYTADQQLRRNDRRATRQNPNGARHGFECPEERDYYPHWAPSPWIDIAVLTDEASVDPCTYPQAQNCTARCNFYLENSMNKNTKGYCDVDWVNGVTVQAKLTHTLWQQNKWPNNPDACTALNTVATLFKWYEVSHSDNLKLSYPVCARTQFSRVNQLGNARDESITSTSLVGTNITTDADGLDLQKTVIHGVNANRLLWQVPHVPIAKASGTTGASTYFTGVNGAGMVDAYKSCVLRIRYNITTADFAAWPETAMENGQPWKYSMVNSSYNARSTDDPRTPVKQDPYVYIGPQKGRINPAFLSLAVNTNQYSRTFQDRSYVFSIKPLPANNMGRNATADTPPLNVTAVNLELSKGRRIYNVNVRGKRGNIVQVYPAVEYDFVPNQLSLEEGDMIHFQWTGSDYNPQRGCNDGEGGPPDPNNFVSLSNNENARADRSNVVMLNYMANNLPRDYLGFDPLTPPTTLTSSEQLETAVNNTLLSAPCFDPSNPPADDEDGAKCYASMMRLAFLDQDVDGGSLQLRRGLACLTQEQLDAISNTDARGTHPLNCAKLNAKPYPYMDAGIVMMKANGEFKFYSSRNNNFSNRDQKGVICVGANCTLNADPNVLQDVNPLTDTQYARANAEQLASECEDMLNKGTGGNDQGATSCLLAPNTTSVIGGDFFRRPNADNDATGSGQKKGCAELFAFDNLGNSIEQDVTLAVILLIVGLVSAWGSYYAYNRWQAHRMAAGADGKGAGAAAGGVGSGVELPRNGRSEYVDSKGWLTKPTEAYI